MIVRTLQLSREMWIFLGVTGVMSAAYLTMTTGEAARKAAQPVFQTPPLEAGKVIDAAITLVSADAYKLSCASDEQMGQAHCGFKADTTPWKGDGPNKPEEVIAPYMTADNVLVLIPGLFTQPLLKKRLEDEPPGKYSAEELENRRFTVTCKLKPEKQFSKLKVRWAQGQSWGDRDSAWAGTVTDCKMTGG